MKTVERINMNSVPKILLTTVLFGSIAVAGTFDLNNAVRKCQKCHGMAFDKRVLHVTKKISEFSKEELIQSFEAYLNAPAGGRKGLMKIIVKKYTKEQREQIAEYIVSQTKK